MFSLWKNKFYSILYNITYGDEYVRYHKHVECVAKKIKTEDHNVKMKEHYEEQKERYWQTRVLECLEEQDAVGNSGKKWLSKYMHYVMKAFRTDTLPLIIMW